MTALKVVLVDENDIECGVEEKLEAHRKGLLHRALSVLIFNSTGEMLLQQRCHEKYHSPGLWTNVCCSHPLQGEDVASAAQKRLEYEMGLKVALRPLMKFLYKTELDKGLTEHELDHVFIGVTDNDPVPNPEEVMAWKWVDMKDIRNQLMDRPADFTPWFRIIIDSLPPTFASGNPIDPDKVTEIPHILPYPHHAGSALVRPEDMKREKSLALDAMEGQTDLQMQQIREQMEVLAAQAKKIADRKEISMMIYNAQISFVPVIGKVYYLYQKKDNTCVLSMVAPEEWGKGIPFESYIATVRLLADHTWDIVDKNNT